MTNTVDSTLVTVNHYLILILQFISVLSRLLGPVAYALQVLIPHVDRTSLSQRLYVALFYVGGIAFFFFTKKVGSKLKVLFMSFDTERLVSSSLSTSLLLLLLSDVCNQQQIILLCILMCGSLQQKLSSILRFENRVQFLHGIPVIFMWNYSLRNDFSTNNLLSVQTASFVHTENSYLALFIAVFPVSVLAASLTYDAIVQSENMILTTKSSKVQSENKFLTAKCLIVNGVFLLCFVSVDANFPKIAGLQISKDLNGEVWTSSDLAIVSTMSVMFATPIARNTGKWLFENLFTQIFFTLFVLVCHWYVSDNDLVLTFAFLFILQIVVNLLFSD